MTKLLPLLMIFVLCGFRDPYNKTDRDILISIEERLIILMEEIKNIKELLKAQKGK